MSTHEAWTEGVCAFCHGTGVDPFGIMSDRSTCVVCGGRRRVQLPADHVPCAHCGGSGAIKTFPCTVCDGKGRVAKLPEPTRICPDCDGWGSEYSNPALECLTCHGRGRVRVANETLRTS
jgi:DnaJ-class molecular chaperone